MALFLIVFLLFLLVFGGLCLWAVVKINKERQGGASPSSVVSTEPTVTFTKEDAQTLFLVTVDKEAQGFLVVRADPANTRVRVMAVPRHTVVDVGTAQKRLFEVYAADGVRQAESAVSGLLGIDFDNYASITYANTEKLLGKLDKGLLFTIPEDLKYQSAVPGESLNMKGGLSTLTPGQVVSLMRYPNWNGGLKQQADVQAQLAAAVVNQYLDSTRDLQQDFDNFIGLLQSDIKVSHFVQAKEGLTYLAARNTGGICSTVSLEGQYRGSGDAIRFEMAESAPQDLSAVFGKK